MQLFRPEENLTKGSSHLRYDETTCTAPRSNARAPCAGGKPLIRDYIALTKPRITWLILMSTGIGYFFGAHGAWDWIALLHTLIGTGLIASGTAALNQWYERDADARMHRTRNRPIPAGRIAAVNALWFAAALSLIGFLELWWGANPLTGILGALTLLVYLFVYTPLKQKSWHATTIGAVPGAMPPLIGYAGAAAQLTPEAWILFAILFLWQFPHFYSIAWMYREDYARGGIRMLPVVEPDGDSTVRQILACSLALIPISLLPRYFGMAGNLYLGGALLLGLAYFYAGLQASRDRTRARARAILLTSVIYLPILYGLMMADRPHL
ncbi:MAG TPA: heme o synthase [Bryobacteraceae bacterium]|nr:heme o synthase [Bryobacteraceae bacterium]